MARSASGALLARREVALTAVQHGGGQERDVRSGTLDVAAIAGFAAAVEVASGRQAGEFERLAVLRDRLVAGVSAAVPDVVLARAGRSPAGAARRAERRIAAAHRPMR